MKRYYLGSNKVLNIIIISTQHKGGFVVCYKLPIYLYRFLLKISCELYYSLTVNELYMQVITKVVHYTHLYT